MNIGRVGRVALYYRVVWVLHFRQHMPALCHQLTLPRSHAVSHFNYVVVVHVVMFVLGASITLVLWPSCVLSVNLWTTLSHQ